MSSLQILEEAIDKYLPKDFNKKTSLLFPVKKITDRDLKTLGKNINAPIRDFVLTGGKRVRPNLFFKVLKTFNIDSTKFVDIGVLLELVHNATLILDDIEDGAMTRRGRPTTHRRYGVDTAINAGMALHIIPLKILERYKDILSEKQIVNLYKIYTDELTKLSMGQTLDIYWHKSIQEKITLPRYIEMVKLKTSCLFRLATRFACSIADVSDTAKMDFTCFSEELGVSFQIMDDVLDLKNDSYKFGKSLGNDITEGKISLPVLLTLKHASKKDAVLLRKILLKHTTSTVLITKALSILNETDAINMAQKMSTDIMVNALDKLTAKYSFTYDLTEISELALFFINRDH